ERRVAAGLAAPDAVRVGGGAARRAGPLPGVGPRRPSVRDGDVLARRSGPAAEARRARPAGRHGAGARPGGPARRRPGADAQRPGSADADGGAGPVGVGVERAADEPDGPRRADVGDARLPAAAARPAAAAGRGAGPAALAERASGTARGAAGPRPA